MPERPERPRRVRLATSIALWVAAVSAGLCLWIADPDALRRWLARAASTSPFESYALYVLFGSLRGFTLIPSTVLVLAAVAFFPPGPLFVLTLAGILTSSASIYWFAESLGLKTILERRHARDIGRLHDLLERHELPIIIGWSFFPLAPTDLIVYVCGVLEVNVAKCLMGVCVGEGAICGLYIFSGNFLLHLLRLR